MSRLSERRVLVSGILSPLLADVLYEVVYRILTNRSADREHDWLFRLSLSSIAMTLPFFFTLVLAAKDRQRQKVLSLSAKIGLALATLSLGLLASPISDGIARAKQSRNQAMQGVPAPLFDTVDISGNRQRLADQRNKVVLINLWATWCGPCRAEMPKLQELYQARQSQGFMVFGISDEDLDVQRKYLKEVPVTYPLLTLKGQVPSIYRDIARYPAVFLIDRHGLLQPAPGPDQPFEKLQSAVDNLLSAR
jgi:thiol-disulfide isomerase/thioredoxin